MSYTSDLSTAIGMLSELFLYGKCITKEYRRFLNDIVVKFGKKLLSSGKKIQDLSGRNVTKFEPGRREVLKLTRRPLSPLKPDFTEKGATFDSSFTYPADFWCRCFLVFSWYFSRVNFIRGNLNSIKNMKFLPFKLGENESIELRYSNHVKIF